jgi:glycosyltransferase involved in cell wall biosynthesis
MKVLTVNHSDGLGGAARAAYRLHRALRGAGIDSRMLVNHSTMGDWSVSAPTTARHKILARVGPHAAQLMCRLHSTTNPISRSPAIIPSRWLNEINGSDADVVHLHWVGAEMLSIEDIGKIRKPVVWTLHDMWAFSGAEHVSTDPLRWRDGYSTANRPASERGWDLNRWVWRRKAKAWRTPFAIVTPSRWLGACVTGSALMHDWPVSVIANTLDTNEWKPVDKMLARSLLGLPEGRATIAFGAWGVDQPHKGFDLLKAALHRLKALNVDVQLLVFGQLAPRVPEVTEYPIHYVGHLSDDLSLRIVYSAADAMVVPSRVESFGQTASEALACGTPVVAFHSSGLPDIIDHMTTGSLARAFESDDLAEGIAWVVESESRAHELGRKARAEAEARFAYPVIAGKYREVYDSLLAGRGTAMRKVRPPAT